ncbi:hypothetical protein D9M69_630110 [compost metagenome]
MQAGDDQRGIGDQGDGPAQVGVPHGRERARQAMLVGAQQHAAKLLHGGAAGLEHGGREPVLQEDLGGCRYVARLQRGGDPLVPLRRGAQVGRRVAQDEAFDPFWGVYAQPLSDDAAQRQPQEMRAGDA